jgi:hypothetical protein
VYDDTDVTILLGVTYLMAMKLKYNFLNVERLSNSSIYILQRSSSRRDASAGRDFTDVVLNMAGSGNGNDTAS